MSHLEPSQIKQILLYALPVAGLLLLLVGLLALRMSRKPKQQELTPEEKQAILEDKALLKAIIAETQKLCKDVPESLAIQNSMVSYYRVKPGAAGKRRRLLRFDAAIVTRTEIWFHFYGRGLPQGVSFADIKDPKNRVLDNLQYAIRRPCRFYEDNDFNLYLRVGLKYALYGIPRLFEWKVAFEALPVTRPLTLAIGINERGSVVYEDLRRWPHLLMAGATQQGKSTQIMQWIITLVKRNTPEELKLILVDLKEGAELEPFAKMPHVLAFVQEEKDVIPQLVYLLQEYEARMKTMKGAGCSNIVAYNKISSKKLPYVVFIVDELADLMIDIPQELDDMIANLLTDEEVTPKKKKKKKLSTSEIAIAAFIILARKARAAGIHLLLCTQVVEAKVLPLQIRSNINGRLCFALPDINASTLVLNNSMATTLEIPGRCVYRVGAENRILQAPIASKDEILEVIESVSQPDPEPPTLADHVLKAIWYNLAGHAPYRMVYDALNGEIGMNAIRNILSDHEYKPEEQGPVIEFDGMRFILYAGHRIHRGTVPRTMLHLNGHDLPGTKEEARLLYERHVTSAVKNRSGAHPHIDEEE